MPFWAVPGYLPSTDGPSHVYNSWLLGRLLGPARAPLLREYFVVNPRPVPNSLTHFALLGLLRVLPPAAAEKALLSGCVLLTAGALWVLAGAVERERAWLALLGLPFTWNLLLGLGFYNFCAGVPLCLLALGLWWRHRVRPGPSFAAAEVALLVLCYFAHILAAVLALAGIGVLWLASWRRERWRGHLLHLAILAPAAALPAWFVLSQPAAAEMPSNETWQALLDALAHLRTLWQFTAEGGVTGSILAAVFGAWVVFTLAREATARARARAARPAAGPAVARAPAPAAGPAPASPGPLRPWLREEDGFLALALLFLAVYLLSPEGAAGGSLLKPRLAMMPYLAVLPWLTTRLGRWGRAAAVAGLAALALRPVTFAVPCYRAGSRDVAAFLRGLDAVPPDSVVVPLIFDRHTTACMRTGSVDHATGYAAMAKGLVDWDDYEAHTDLFPVRFRPWAVRPRGLDVEGHPGEAQPARLATRVDYIYCWRMPPGAPVAGRLARCCTQVAAGAGWRLYAVAPSPPPPPSPPRGSDTSTVDSSSAPRAAYSP